MVKRLQVSDKLRRWIGYAFYAGFVFILVLDVFITDLPLYILTLVVLLYGLGIPEILSPLIGGSSGEQTYRFMFPIGAVADAVPKVFERKRKWRYLHRIYGEIVTVDASSRHFVARTGWFRWTYRVAIDLDKLDETSTQVHALSEMKYFVDWGGNRKMIQRFLAALYYSIDEGRQTQNLQEPAKS